MSRISRRDTLTAGLGAGLAAIGGSAAPAQAPAGQAMVTLLLVNDIYKMGEENGRGGLFRCSTSMAATCSRPR